MRVPYCWVRQGVFPQRTYVPLHLQVQETVDVGLHVVEEPALVAFEVLHLCGKQRFHISAGGCLRLILLLLGLRRVEELRTLAVVDRLSWW